MNRIEKIVFEDFAYAFVLVNEKDEILEWEFVYDKPCN